MALPRIVAMDCSQKRPWVDGNVLVVFYPKTTEDSAKGSNYAGDGLHYGYLKVLLDPTVAADFAVGTEYTFTATVGD